MNARAEILAGAALTHAVDVLQIRAEARAYLEYEHQFEFNADAVDPLQEYAESSGLVAAIGQDAVQGIIAAPFARFRAIVAAEIEAEEIATIEHDLIDLPPDYAAQIVRQWEMSDPRDAWWHTGEAPPKAIPVPAAICQQYRTPQAAIDAFFHVADLGDADHLNRWLQQHQRDAETLCKLWEGKHADKA
jgi:hypothetical protein